ncbi:hypothetical protein HALLA_17215 [Halostagnicola larsenii XH-48]|uniref:Uncharacterized protein n=2 Tax=Halostagnicola larsenii TaxID=353800 RepID=W0JR80_9EURY|nr:hypothetical protein HALLA_17215 [Halostagnicola larsenii XH-48]
MAAFCIGIGWGSIVLRYVLFVRTAAGSGGFDERSRWYVVGEVFFMGGGTGIMLYLTDTVLESFVFGLSGLSFVVIADTLAHRLTAYR